MSDTNDTGGFPAWGTVPTRPRCHECRRVIVVDLHADDDLWEAVIGERDGSGYRCVECFASHADEKMIDWAPYVRLVPYSLARQHRHPLPVDQAALVRELGVNATPPAEDAGERVRAMREAVALIDEINERAPSRAFNGIGQALHAKLCTIRATLARSLATPEPQSIDRAGEGAWPEKLTPELRALLGLMCFQLAGPAHVYQKAGMFVGEEGELRKRAEDEQAFMLHKLLGFWFADPAGWADTAQAELNTVRAALFPDQGPADGGKR